jgi:hypothetical protein
MKLKGGIPMSKKITLSLCISLLLVSTAFAPGAFAADVETNGDLDVYGQIWSHSGGFKFPDGTTWTTGGMSGLLFNVGFVVDNSNSNPGDLSMGAIKFGTGATGEAIASQRIGSGNVNGLDFYTKSLSRLAITNDGKVGIGTRTPNQALDVVGNIKASGVVSGVSGTFSNSAGDGLYVITSSANGNGIYAIANNGAQAYGVWGTSTSGYGVVGTASGTNGQAGGRFISNASNGVALVAESPQSTQVMKVDAKGVHAGPGMTGTPLAFAKIAYNGNMYQSHSSNVTAVTHTEDTGVYEITIANEDFNEYNDTAVATPYATVGFITWDHIGDSPNGHLLIKTFNTSGSPDDMDFSFIVMKQ